MFQLKQTCFVKVNLTVKIQCIQRINISNTHVIRNAIINVNILSGNPFTHNKKMYISNTSSCLFSIYSFFSMAQLSNTRNTNTLLSLYNVHSQLQNVLRNKVWLCHTGFNIPTDFSTIKVVTQKHLMIGIF